MSASLDRLFGLEGRVALVTGVSRGIGAAIASGLTAAGASVYGVGRSETAEVDLDGVSYHVCDVCDTSAVQKLCEDIYSHTKRLDILVNAAGISLPSGASNEPSETFRKTLATNLTAVFECCRLTVPYMARNGTGSIINVTSIGALLGFPGNPAYVATKGGVAAMTRALALDHGEQGIRVNNLVPGYVHTKMTAASFSDPENYQQRVKHTILDRWGKPDDLVGAAIFLSSEASSYVTGIDLVVDGGWTAKGL